MISNNNDKIFSTVAVKECKTYIISEVQPKINFILDSITNKGEIFSNKKIVIKPNLLMKCSPEKSVTTHPVVVEAVINYIKDKNPEKIILAESPGGPYSETTLKIIYKSTGMTDVCRKTDVKLNYDTDFTTVNYNDGVVCKTFDIINPILDCDVIVDLCKLKTHSLTTMSGAVKNLFGTIPGIHKFEMHTRFPELDIFEKMIIDLCMFHLSRTSVISVCDGIIGMEGNGPSGGDSQNFAVLAGSANPFSLDLYLSRFLNLNNTVGIVKKSIDMKLCPDDVSKLIIAGDTNLSYYNVKLPDTKSLFILKNLGSLLGGKFNKFFEPKPIVDNKKCLGCGTCVKSCPMKTIDLIDYKNTKKAKINHEKCIKCFCCQELCEYHAVKIKSNFIFKIFK